MQCGRRAGYYLKLRYTKILHYTGLILIISGLLFLLPVFVSIKWKTETLYTPDFIIPALIISIFGIILWKVYKPSESVILTVQEGGIIVFLSWIIVMLFSSLPFVTVLKFNFTHALFEAVSGWTTTGLTVVDVSGAPKIILMWRSIMQMAGGAGFAIMMLATITGPIGTGITYAEGRREQLVPHVRESAKRVLVIYAGYILLGFIAYYTAGMNIFDSINHTFSTVSTGGFSTHTESIGYFNSITIEIISIPLMLLGSLNFLTAYLLFHGKFKAVFRNGEVRLGLILIIISSFTIYLLIARFIYPNLTKSIRISIFETVTAITTTGFTTTSYINWIPAGMIIITILMIVGGGTGSTAGGIKLYRVYVIIKSIFWQLKRYFLPRTAVVENYIWHGERKNFINDKYIRIIFNFAFFYLIVFILGSVTIAAHGYGIKESLFEFASALGTVGLSTGITSQTAPPLILWTEIFGMFLGRLEFFVIILSFIKIIRDSRIMLKYN